MSRPEWSETFLGIAEMWSRRSTCTRRKVGAVVVRGIKVIGQGYNGVASGKTHCEDGGCPRGRHYHKDELGCACGKSWPCPDSAVPGSDYNANPCYAIHAEHNAILDAGLEECKGATLYVTAEPCQQCLNLIEHVGIERVVIRGR